MNNHSILYSIVILITIIGITSCDDAGLLADESTNPNTSNQDLLQPGTAPPSSFDSTQITLESGVANGIVDLEVIDQQQGLISFDATSSDPSVLTNTISINTPYAPPSSDPALISIPHQVYKYAPSSITYNGSSQLSFLVNGSYQSKTLSGHEQDILGWMQTFRTYANEAGTGGGGPTPIENSFAGANSSNQKGEINLDKMTDQQIKKWLKEKGYNVKKLGNRQFELTLVLGEEGANGKLYIHSLFDAGAGEMTPLGISKNNKKFSKTLVKKQNGKRKHITQTEHSLFKDKAKKMFMKITSNQ